MEAQERLDAMLMTYSKGTALMQDTQLCVHVCRCAFYFCLLFPLMQLFRVHAYFYVHAKQGETLIV